MGRTIYICIAIVFRYDISKCMLIEMTRLRYLLIYLWFETCSCVALKSGINCVSWLLNSYISLSACGICQSTDDLFYYLRRSWFALSRRWLRIGDEHWLKASMLAELCSATLILINFRIYMTSDILWWHSHVTTVRNNLGILNNFGAY